MNPYPACGTLFPPHCLGWVVGNLGTKPLIFSAVRSDLPRPAADLFSSDSPKNSRLLLRFRFTKESNSLCTFLASAIKLAAKTQVFSPQFAIFGQICAQISHICHNFLNYAAILLRNNCSASRKQYFSMAEGWSFTPGHCISLLRLS